MGGFAEPAAVSLPAVPGASLPVWARVEDGRLRISLAGAETDTGRAGALLDVSCARLDGLAPAGRGTVMFSLDGTRLALRFPSRRPPIGRLGSPQRCLRALARGAAPADEPRSPAPAAVAGEPTRSAPAPPAPGARTAGLFLTHRDEPRIERHLERLVGETAGLISWEIVVNRGNLPAPHARHRVPEPADVLAARYAQMQANGGLLSGRLDVLWIPLALGVDADHVWLCEYDVDYAGLWGDLFGQFSANGADVLCTTLASPAETTDWVHWRGTSCPGWVAAGHVHRSFLPLMRISSRFALAYAVMMADSHWRGHFEFMLPTAALAAGATLEDLGGDGAFTPPERRGRNYSNRPTGDLRPGTFLWRPVWPAYFGEQPAAFAERDRLYHPVKPGVPNWEQAVPERTEV